MRILVTGSRDWTNERAVAKGLRYALDTKAKPGEPVVVVHGKARGADEIADGIAKSWGLATEPHPAMWGKYQGGAGPIRNTEMVLLGADICLGFPEEDSVGTWDCMRKAAHLGIETYNFSTGEPHLYEVKS